MRERAGKEGRRDGERLREGEREKEGEERRERGRGVVVFRHRHAPPERTSRDLTNVSY